jgi:hypothetical protein
VRVGGRRDMREREQTLTALASMGEPRRPKIAKARKRPVRDTLARLMRKRGWGHKTPQNGLRRRLYSLTIERHQWWDWGHRLMILTGSDWGGNWGSPEPPTWWYRQVRDRRMWRTGYPTRPVFQLVKDYDLFGALTEGLNEDGMYPWRALCVHEDGHEMILGHAYWGNWHFSGITKGETKLIGRYMRMWRRYDWWGLRSWLYCQGLDAAVHQRKPRACNVTPPAGTGGYDHWHCDQKRRHKGDHRFRNYTWPGGTAKVEYKPRESA